MADSNNKTGVDSKTRNQIHMMVEAYNNDPKGFIKVYGQDGVDMLVEATRRLSVESSINSTKEEQAATNAFSDEMQQYVNTTSNPSQTLGKNYKDSTAVRWGKGGHKGTVMAWNSMVDMSRGLFDPENHAKWIDLIQNRFRSNENQDKMERWMERLKGDAINGRKGFVGSWMRTVAEPWEYKKYGRFSEEELAEVAAPWMKATLPYADENLGIAGKIGEIMAQEIMFMGPLTIIRLARARHAVKYFNDRAKKSISNVEGRWVKGEGWVSAQKLAKREGKEAGYEDYISILKTMPDKEAKKMKRLYTMGVTEGKIPVIGKFGGGGMIEAEAMTSAVVVGAGTYGNVWLGEKGQLVGEVGGGIMGPALLAKVGRYGLDWMNYFGTKIPGTPETKMNRTLRMLKYSQDEIDNLDDITKKKMFNMISAMPLPTGFSIFDLSSRDRKNLLAYRWFDKEFQALPPDLREKMLSNLADIEKLTAKFDPQQKGLFFATMDRALNMGALRTMRDKLRADYKLGKMVSVRFNEMDIRLAEREAQMTSELANILKEYEFAKFDDVGFNFLRDTLTHEVHRRVVDVEMNAIPEAKRWLTEAKKAHLKIVDPEFYSKHVEAIDIANHRINPNTAKLERVGEASKLKTIQEGGKTKLATRFDPETGKTHLMPELDKYGNPVTFISEDAQKYATMGHDELLKNSPIWDELAEVEKLHEKTSFDATTGGRALKAIRNIMDSNNAIWINVADTGKPKSYALLIRPSTELKLNPMLSGHEARKLLNTAYKTDKGRSSALYDKVLKNEKINILDGTRANEFTSELGNAAFGSMGRMPRETQEAIQLHLKAGKVHKWLMKKRRAAINSYKQRFIDNAPEGVSKQQRLIEFEQEIDSMFSAEILQKEGIDLKNYSLQEKINDIIETADIKLDAKLMPMDVTVSEIKQLRTDIMDSHRTLSFDKQDERLAAVFDQEVVNTITDFMDTVPGMEGANSYWKSNVLQPWHQGTGRKILSRLPSGEHKYADEKLFDFFVNADDAPYDMAEQFRRLATRVDPETGTVTLDTNMIDHLQAALFKRLKKSKPNREWFNAFGDHIDLRTGGIDDVNMTALDEAKTGLKGQSKYQTVMETEQQVREKLGQVGDSLEPLLDVQYKERVEAAWRAYDTDWGMSVDDMQRLIGDATADEAKFRAVLLDETYKGGNPEKALSVYQYIREIPDMAQRQKATNSLRQLLWHGAVEAAEDSRGAATGIEFFRGNTDVAQIRHGMEMNSLAMQLYTDRNSKVLKSILGDKGYRDLQDMTSLAVLVTGEVDPQAIKNLPTEMQLKSIMSRVYGVVRQVVSPRYVLTELLIQDARFRKGKLLQEIAADPDATRILTQVVLRNGLTNPRIRTEFVSKFWGRTMIPTLREKEDIREEERFGAAWSAPKHIIDMSEEVYDSMKNPKQ